MRSSVPSSMSSVANNGLVARTAGGGQQHQYDYDSNSVETPSTGFTPLSVTSTPSTAHQVSDSYLMHSPDKSAAGVAYAVSSTPAAGAVNHSNGDPPSSPAGRTRPRSLRLRLLIGFETCLDYFVRWIGPILSILAIFLICFITYVYFTETLPLVNARVCHAVSEEAIHRYTTRASFVVAKMHGRDGLINERSGRFVPIDPNNPEPTNQLLQQSLIDANSIPTSSCTSTQFVTFFGLYLLFNILFHYLSAMLKGPGRVPSSFSQEVLDHLVNYDPERRDDQPIRFCKPCNKVKPMRAHHCRVCGKCSLKMDHHCPWVNNCIGWRNLRHFHSFLFYLWSGCAFFLLTSFDSAMGVIFDNQVAGTQFLIACIITFAVLVAGSLFLAWCGYLLFTNQTTIEFYGNHWGTKPGNPYDLGTWRNIAAVFGEGGIWVLLFPSLMPPPGDGIIFPLNAGRGMPLPMLVDERAA